FCVGRGRRGGSRRPYGVGWVGVGVAAVGVGARVGGVRVVAGGDASRGVGDAMGGGEGDAEVWGGPVVGGAVARVGSGGRGLPAEWVDRVARIARATAGRRSRRDPSVDAAGGPSVRRVGVADRARCDPVRVITAPDPDHRPGRTGVGGAPTTASSAWRRPRTRSTRTGSSTRSLPRRTCGGGGRPAPGCCRTPCWSAVRRFMSGRCRGSSAYACWRC